MYVCVCNAVTDRDIRRAAQQGVDNMTRLREQLKVGTCCGRCNECARNILNQALESGNREENLLVLPMPV